MMLCAIWHHLYNLKNVKNTHGGVLLLIKLQALKITILHGRFSRFLNCTNGTKLRKSFHMRFLQMQVLHYAFTLIFDHVSVTILNISFFTVSFLRNF